MNPIDFRLENFYSSCLNYIDDDVEYYCDRQICDHYKFSIYMVIMFMDKVGR